MVRLANIRAYLLAPLLLFAVILCTMYMHPSVPFSNDGNCDPWYIFGMFYTFRNALHWFPDAYQVSRLTEILPGYVFTRVFPNITADYALFLLEYSISVVLFYGAVRRLLTPQIAVFSGLFLVLSPLMIGNFSTTLDAPAVMFDIVNLYFVAAAMDCPDPRRRYALIFASGVALALALNAYVAIGIFLAGNYVIYVTYSLTIESRETRKRVRLILVSLLFMAAGALATFLVLGLAVIAFHGDFSQAFIQFVFLLSLFSDFLKIGRGVGGVYWHSTWYEQGAITGMLVLAGGMSILNLIRFRKVGLEKGADLRKKLVAISFGVFFVEAALLAANAAGFVLLQYDYYYVFFVPYLALVIFSPLAFISPFQGRSVAVFAIIFSAAGLLANSFTDAQLPAVYGDAAQSHASIMTALLVAPLSAAVFWHKRQLALIVIVIIGSLAVLVERPVQLGVSMWTESRPQEQADADGYARVRQGLVFLHSLHFTVAPSIFWLDPDPSFGTELVAFPRSYLQCGFWSLPTHPTGAPPLAAGENVIVVASPNQLVQKVATALSAMNARAQRVSQYDIDFKGVRYEILVLRITGPIKSVGNASYRSSVGMPLSRALSCSGQSPDGPIVPLVRLRSGHDG